MPNGFLKRELLPRFDPVAVILSPPRCGSTALACSLWQHPAFRWYLHEPCDWAYHIGSGPPPGSVTDALIDRASFPTASAAGSGVVVKEMTFQAGDAIAEFQAATLPVIFLVRDPRLAVLSRMRRRESDGDIPAFPAREAGWQDLLAALALFRQSGTPSVIVDIADIRRSPGVVLRALCDRLGLPWDTAMLRWQSLSGLSLGNLGGCQDAWYARVLGSTSWEGPDEEPPPDEVFDGSGMRPVIAESLDAYRTARLDPRFLAVG